MQTSPSEARTKICSTCLSPNGGHANWCVEELGLEDWNGDAACGGLSEKLTKEICVECPVIAQCLTFAITHRIDTTEIWGGATHNERERLGRRNPAQRIHDFITVELPRQVGTERWEQRTA